MMNPRKFNLYYTVIFCILLTGIEATVNVETTEDFQFKFLYEEGINILNINNISFHLMTCGEASIALLEHQSYITDYFIIHQPPSSCNNKTVEKRSFMLEWTTKRLRLVSTDTNTTVAELGLVNRLIIYLAIATSGHHGLWTFETEYYTNSWDSPSYSQSDILQPSTRTDSSRVIRSSFQTPSTLMTSSMISGSSVVTQFSPSLYSADIDDDLSVTPSFETMTLSNAVQSSAFTTSSGEYDFFESDAITWTEDISYIMSSSSGVIFMTSSPSEYLSSSNVFDDLSNGSGDTTTEADDTTTDSDDTTTDSGDITTDSDDTTTDSDDTTTESDDTTTESDDTTTESDDTTTESDDTTTDSDDTTTESDDTTTEAAQCEPLCKCVKNDDSVDDLSSVVGELVKKLSINASKTSKSIRKKTSAADNRPTSVSVGVFGIVLLVSTFTLLIAPDIVAVVVYIYRKLIETST